MLNRRWSDNPDPPGKRLTIQGMEDIQELPHLPCTSCMVKTKKSKTSSRRM